MLSAKSVKIRLIDNDSNQPIFGCPVVLPNSADTKHIGVTDIYGEIILDVPADGMSVELRSPGYKHTVINAVNDTTFFLDLDEELYRNPLWVVNGTVVEVYYPYIWNPDIHTLKQEVAKAIKIINEDDIVSAVAVNNSDIPACDTDVDKFLLITATAQYQNISNTNFKAYQ